MVHGEILMTVDITGRHIEITEPLRKFATDRLEKLRGIIDEVIEVHLILTVEKHQRNFWRLCARSIEQTIEITMQVSCVVETGNVIGDGKFHYAIMLLF